MSQVWKCEFCGLNNVIDEPEKEEVPVKESYDYVLEPPTQPDAKHEANTELVVFCIDISGSMCVTTEVPGNFKMKGLKKPSVDIEVGKQGVTAQCA